MDALLIQLVFVTAIILFWSLLFRIGAVLIKLDPYHPVTQFLFWFTDYLVRPFRVSIFRRPARVDPAVIPPLIILLIIIILSGLNL
jgi:uncharacterized protein YggT (Ycf19 family)